MRAPGEAGVTQSTRFFALALALALPVGAHTALRIKHDDKYWIVRKVQDGRTYAVQNGKPTKVEPDR